MWVGGYLPIYPHTCRPSPSHHPTSPPNPNPQGNLEGLAKKHAALSEKLQYERVSTRRELLGGCHVYMWLCVVK